MQTNYNTSVNIVRDAGREISYIPTANAKRSAAQIGSDFKSGVHSFSLIGSYGTGKSSFLWAFQRSFSKKSNHFDIPFIKGASTGVINIVGSYMSLKQALEEHFGLEAQGSEKLIFSELFNSYHDLGNKNPLLLLCIDEFGKFLEYAAANQPEQELYFIQQLLEFVNDPKRGIILISTIHQSIDAYGLALTSLQKQEWSKIKGRFREITFNEPVEQLLYLAASHLESQRSADIPSDAIAQVIELLLTSKSFDTNPVYLLEIAEKLFPLDIFAANMVTLALQRYGQNERSLFSFLKSTDHTSIFAHQLGSPNFYNVASVYQYLIYNFYSYINSPYNRDIAAWRGIQHALEVSERIFNEDLTGMAQLIQTIGLFNIFAANGSIIDKPFLIQYAATCLNMFNAADLLTELENRKVILFRNYSRRYILFEGTDLDIQLALFEAGNKVDQVVDVTGLINKYYKFPPVVAKEVSYRRGTPRLFEYLISTLPQKKVAKGEIDGFINLIFNENLKETDLIQYSAGQNEAILYGFYKNSRHIKDLLFEIEKTKKVIDENTDDDIAVKELTNIITHQQNLLTHKILNSTYNNQREVIWIYRGQVLNIPSKRALNQQLSAIVNDVYSHAPIFKNELVNKNKISPSIHTAKRNYIKALVNNWDKPQLGFGKDKYPPEKTIFLSLLESNGITLYHEDNDYEIAVNEANDFQFLWNFSNEFLYSSRASRRSVKELNDLLALKPFKLKQGLIDFWLVSFLFIKRNDFSLFYKGNYVANINDEILEILIKSPADYEVKAFDIGGVKLNLFNNYRVLVEQTTKQHLTNKDFVDTIKPFLTFYKGLPDYAKNTQRLSAEAMRLRESIVKAKDPEQTFFEAFPAALGFTLQGLQQSPEKLQQYVEILQTAIRELRTCYAELINRVEAFLTNDVVGGEMVFPEVKTELQNRYRQIRLHLLLQKQKVIVQRINSELDDRTAWFNSIAQGVMGVTLEKFSDETEWAFYDKLKFTILELDSLTELSQINYEESKEDVLHLDISSFGEGLQRKIVRVPKNLNQAI
ncbi:MAG TPA: hypothetical protein VGM63_24305, partial [Mucilaginibacter sp.]